MSDPALIAELRAAVGEDGIVTDADEVRWSKSDALSGGRASGFAEPVEPIAVVAPATTEEVVAVVRVAATRGVPLIAYGGGTGLMGGARSTARGIVLELKRMRQVREVDPVSQYAWIESGATLSEANDALAAHGLIVGHDPWTFDIATIGGTLSTNGLGFVGGKYGSMGEQVLAIEAVMPDGSVVSTRAVRPRSTGFDLRALFIGTEGQFGIVTAAALRLFPLPELQRRLGFRFVTFEQGFEAILAMHRIGVRPALLDFGERPAADTASTLYLGFEGFAEEVDAQSARVGRICRDGGGERLDEDEVESFWTTRHVIAENFARRRRAGLTAPDPHRAFDYVHVSLPPSRVLGYRRRATTLADERNVQVVECGIWVGPGLFSLVLEAEGSDAAERMSDVVNGCLRLAQEHGGSMEYCHGVGVRLAHLMREEHGAGLDVMRSLKRMIDPHGVMNPGKESLSEARDRW